VAKSRSICRTPPTRLGAAAVPAQGRFRQRGCAALTDHNTSERARLGVEQLLHDGRKLADLIARTADIHVADRNSARRSRSKPGAASRAAG
jgi:hypothetical protein